jgi:hypothetical protein
MKKAGPARAGFCHDLEALLPSPDFLSGDGPFRGRLLALDAPWGARSLDLRLKIKAEATLKIEVGITGWTVIAWLYAIAGALLGL